ncbi:MAG: metallopeptidase TldD-related protein [Gammaproteobacteria bacterium]|nr:metallopeptidase TldD-related protein [Gammaproteobacteria bacterium]
MNFPAFYARRLAPAVLAVLVFAAFPVKAQEDVVLQAMQTELDRSMEALGIEKVPPYFLSYEITETRGFTTAAEFGALTASDQGHMRTLDIDLRVGDYELDNTRRLRDQRIFFAAPAAEPVQVPVEDDANALRAVLWSQTDRHYKRALERFTRVETDVQVKVETVDKAGDFSPAPASKAVEAMPPLEADPGQWQRKVERYTAPFAEHGEIYDARARFEAEVETRWFVNSEGSALRSSRTAYRLFVTARTKADDGMELPLNLSYFALNPAGLPDDETVENEIVEMIATLLALREAPLVEPYTGPAILAGEASGVFFHEILGHRVEGHRQKSEEEGQTFRKKVGERLLPKSFSVYFDPTVWHYGNTDLAGAYRFDNEGIEAQRVTVIEDGIFRNFLMSRSPIDGFASSNGHGRKEPGHRTVSRQSNLIVEVAQPLSRQELNARLIADIEKEGKPFGLRIEQIRGGFTTTGRIMPNSFNVTPLVVYRVYPDGSEELVRGVDLIGTPLTTLSRVVAGDDQVAVFNGICGAESGGVPVSAASPSILVSQIEVQKKAKSQSRPPILPPPLEPADPG